MLRERGLLTGQVVQANMIEALQTCADFSKLDPMARAHVTKQMADRGHLAVFGVKYHAELAWIERKWMELKRRIRRRLNGKLATLKSLLISEFSEYSIQDARKAARHCRETMRAYQISGADPASLQRLKLEEVQMKGHRRVFDAADGLLKVQAGIEQTVREK